MEVRILHKFHDRVDYTKVYLVGETVIFDDARAESLIKRGLVEKAEEPIEVDVESDTEADDAQDIEPAAEVDEEEPIETPNEEVKNVVKPVATKRKPKNE